METNASLAAVLSHYQHSNWNADIVVVTGDLIQDDSEQAYERFCEMLGALELPVYCVPGNHDVREKMRAALSDDPFHYCEPFKSNDWLLLGMDSCAAGRAGGLATPRDLARLDEAIASTYSRHIMICLHHPPVSMGSAWLDTVGLDNGEEFLQHATASEKVKLAIFGHVHQEHDSQQGSLRIIGTPSTCRQFERGSDEFAIDELPPAYRRIILHSDGTFESELIWVEDAR